MVVLSDAQIKSKTKLDNLEDVKNLNVCGQGIDDVSILQQAPNIEVLSLSVNKISSLRHFAFCSQLKQLYLRANGVSDLAEVRYLMGLQHLRVLWLADNPCTKLPYYRAVVVANLPNLENLDNVAVNDADRQAAKGIRQLQPATAADVLAEDQESAAAAAAAAAQEADQPAADAQQQPGSSQGQSAVREPRVQHHHQPLPHITSPRPSTSASSVPLTAAGTPAAAAGLPRRGSAQPARPAPSPEPTDMPSSADSTPGLGYSPNMDQSGRRPSSARTGYTTPTATAAAPSVTGSYRASPEPPSDWGLQQQGRGHSVTVTPRDLGRASSTGVGITPGHQGEPDTSRQLYGEHSFGSSPARQQPLPQQQYSLHQHHHLQQEQCKPWAGAVGSEQAGYQQYTPSSPCPPPRQQQQVLVWRPPEGASAGQYHPGGGVSPPAASRTNVLYAVMALLGELDVSGLSIVQREVQMRLMEQQQ